MELVLDNKQLLKENYSIKKDLFTHKV